MEMYLFKDNSRLHFYVTHISNPRILYLFRNYESFKPHFYNLVCFYGAMLGPRAVLHLTDTARTFVCLKYRL
jgi:hypothetical protein